jgi:hypothetical protein
MRSVFAPLLVLVALASTVHAQGRYANIVNDSFATVSSGPQSSTIVDLPAGATESQTDAAIGRRLKALWSAQAASLRASLPAVRGATRARKGAELVPVSTLVQVREGGRLKTRPVTRAVGNGTLTFTFRNFNNAQVIVGNGQTLVVENYLRDFVATIYPRIVALYGAPAVSGNVEIVSQGFYESGNATDVQRFAFGAYRPDTNQILLPLYESIDSTAHALLLNVIHAFHGPAVFSYDAWEQGFARAAATVIARDAVPGFPQRLGFIDPTANFLYTLLPRYDLLNQPALGNGTFFPPSQANVPIDRQFTVVKMLLARLGMSGAAWLKCWIEDAAFFRKVNTAYYAQYNPGDTAGLAGNVPALKGIAAAALPVVEGLAFDDWYRRQYVLETRVTIGEKLFAFPFPFEADAQNNQSASVALVYYRTEPTGDETLLNGRAYATYFDFENARVNLGAQSETSAIIDGEGAVTPTIIVGDGFGAGRITMDFSCGGANARSHLATGYTGDLQALVLGANAAGQATIGVDARFPALQTRSRSAALVSAGFGASLGSQVDELARVTIEVDNQGNKTTYQRNIGDGVNYLVLRSPGKGGVTTVSRVFASSPLPTLVSFPVQPLTPDPLSAFALPATDFLLSSWENARSDYQTYAPNTPSLPALTPGRGFWFKSLPRSGAPQTTVRLTGTAPPTDTDVSIAAPFGWSLVGSPFSERIPIANLRVKFQESDPVSWADAVASNLVADKVFAFDPAVGYVLTDAIDAPNWQAVWVRVYAPAGVTLLVPGPDSVTRSVPIAGRSRAAASTGAAQWSLSVVARQSDPSLPFGGRASATLGAAAGASRAFDPRIDIEAPPAVVPALAIDFGSGSGGGRRVTDYRSPSEALRGSWNLRVTSPTGGPVTLTWDGLARVPAGVRLLLVDGNRRVALAQRSAQTIDTRPGVTREFQVVAESVRQQPLAITRLATVPTRGGSQTIEVVVTGDAEIAAEVTTVTGRSVRQLAAGRSRGGDRMTLSWDGRDGEGRPLPVGAYSLTVTARDAEGAQVRMTRPMMVVR